jgi:hypothetical protein
LVACRLGGDVIHGIDLLHDRPIRLLQGEGKNEQADVDWVEVLPAVLADLVAMMPMS